MSLPLKDKQDREWEPWCCSVCGLFVYNLDEQGYPAPGAPTPKFISTEYPIVCQVCWSLYTTVDRLDYFVRIQRAFRESEVLRGRSVKRLRPGGDYLRGTEGP